jgi:5-methylcytosine-specific restriction endonuclease McrA
MNVNTVLLNSDYSPLGIISWKKAMKLICKKKVDVIKYSEIVISNFEKTFVTKIPLIIKLVKLIRTLWRVRVPFSKRTVIIRDNFVCAYCGVRVLKGLTIDHVIPKSKGGKSTFENTVSCCFDCNNKKDNRTPSEAKMYLKFKPYTPTIMEFLVRSIKQSGMEETLNELEKLGVI